MTSNPKDLAPVCQFQGGPQYAVAVSPPTWNANYVLGHKYLLWIC